MCVKKLYTTLNCRVGEDPEKKKENKLYIYRELETKLLLLTIKNTGRSPDRYFFFDVSHQKFDHSRWILKYPSILSFQTFQQTSMKNATNLEGLSRVDQGEETPLLSKFSTAATLYWWNGAHILHVTLNQYIAGAQIGEVHRNNSTRMI